VEPSELLTFTTAVLERLGVPYAVVGSMASSYFGEARLTNDVDILADIRPEHVHGLIAAFPPEQFYLSEDAVREAINHKSQFNIIVPEAGLKVDIILPAGDAYDAQRLQRKILGRLHGTSQPSYFASPEDVIIKKLEFHLEGGSDKHIRDIAGILKASFASVDTKYIEAFAERMGNVEGWREAQRRAGKPPTA
jgi:hypothetical protein